MEKVEASSRSHKRKRSKLSKRRSRAHYNDLERYLNNKYTLVIPGRKLEKLRDELQMKLKNLIEVNSPATLVPYGLTSAGVSVKSSDVDITVIVESDDLYRTVGKVGKILKEADMKLQVWHAGKWHGYSGNIDPLEFASSIGFLEGVNFLQNGLKNPIQLRIEDIKKSEYWEGRHKRLKQLQDAEKVEISEEAPTHGSDPHFMNLPLYIAAKKGNIDGFIDALDTPSTIYNQMTPLKNTVLHVAASSGNEDLTGFLKKSSSAAGDRTRIISNKDDSISQCYCGFSMS